MIWRQSSQCKSLKGYLDLGTIIINMCFFPLKLGQSICCLRQQTCWPMPQFNQHQLFVGLHPCLFLWVKCRILHGEIFVLVRQYIIFAFWNSSLFVAGGFILTCLVINTSFCWLTSFEIRTLENSRPLLGGNFPFLMVISQCLLVKPPFFFVN